MSWPSPGKVRMTGSAFFMKAAAMNWHQRDSMAMKEILAGNMPSFLAKFKKVKVSLEQADGRTVEAIYFVAPDYLSVGSDNDWARIPLTPMAAQKVADSLGCFLPTRKMVDDIYKAADLRLEPVPMYAFRDSSPTMWQHHLIIEGQRRQKEGLIAGIKKDIVISGSISRHTRPDRVAIYGWHRSNGKAIQPLYTGHVNWYVDYSHGARLVYRKIRVNGKWIDYTAVLNDPLLRKLLCDEEYCDFPRYAY